MAKYKFKTDLSVDGIKELRRQLQDYKNNILQSKLKTFAERLAEEGVEIAQANVASLEAVFTGELFNSIHSEDGGASNGSAFFYVVADSEHAAFVEFGTGQRGEESPYPYDFPDGVNWEYNSGSTIIEFKPGEYGWLYPRDGKWYFTQGMPSRPFMYMANMELYNRVKKIAKEVFG